MAHHYKIQYASCISTSNSEKIAVLWVCDIDSIIECRCRRWSMGQDGKTTHDNKYDANCQTCECRDSTYMKSSPSIFFHHYHLLHHYHLIANKTHWNLLVIPYFGCSVLKDLLNFSFKDVRRFIRRIFRSPNHVPVTIIGTMRRITNNVGTERTIPLLVKRAGGFVGRWVGWLVADWVGDSVFGKVVVGDNVVRGTFCNIWREKKN